MPLWIWKMRFREEYENLSHIQPALKIGVELRMPGLSKQGLPLPLANTAL